MSIAWHQPPSCLFASPLSVALLFAPALVVALHSRPMPRASCLFPRRAVSRLNTVPILPSPSPPGPFDPGPPIPPSRWFLVAGLLAPPPWPLLIDISIALLARICSLLSHSLTTFLSHFGCHLFLVLGRGSVIDQPSIYLPIYLIPYLSIPGNQFPSTYPVLDLTGNAPSRYQYRSSAALIPQLNPPVFMHH